MVIEFLQLDKICLEILEVQLLLVDVLLVLRVVVNFCPASRSV